VFPLRKSSGAETTRQFAGLRLAEHTNERFKLLSEGVAQPRLSTAFDGITLYGDDSGDDRGSLGKIGEGGVAIDSLDDMKILYDGFDFANISTSLTINGCAIQMLALFFNAAIDSTIEAYRTRNPEKAVACDPTLPMTPDQLASLTDTDIHPHYGLPVSAVNEITAETFKALRGTIQADILKEIQAQNECLYQMDFSIRLMADMQQFFIDHEIRKFYSVSISGYHIGEAGSTPIQEMAFTTANGFTYLENYLARGMHVDDICRNFSFFFRDSNEIEWLALGPVLRKVWAIAIRDVYKGNVRSQQFKYHTQTSGRALQVMEWDTLNPLRQTYQALIALLGGTNSLHVDSADEPLTTPSEKFVRQATMIPNYLTMEVELLRQQNLLSGSYGFRDLRKVIQEEVLDEYMRLDDHGGVAQAMELDYQRSCIAEASLNYEIDIWNGTRPIVGRNFCKSDVQALEMELMRPTSADFVKQLERTGAFKERNAAVRDLHLDKLKQTINTNGNVFAELMTVMRFCTLGQTTRLLASQGGKFSQTI
jgi:methylmalonyl-CoA mutase